MYSAIVVVAVAAYSAVVLVAAAHVAAAVALSAVAIVHPAAGYHPCYQASAYY